MNNLALRSIPAVVAFACLAAHPGLAAEQSTLPLTNSHQAVGRAGIGPASPRYIVVSARSVKTANTNVATVIRIINTSNATCNYRVKFTFTNQNTSICNVDAMNVPPWGAGIFCSRLVPDGTGADIAPCFATCNPQLTFTEAKAVIFSTKTDACAHMAVDAIQVYTDTTDTAVQGVRSPAIVKFDPEELAKTNKGD
jgi:hypothetical protein